MFFGSLAAPAGRAKLLDRFRGGNAKHRHYLAIIVIINA